MGHNRSSLSSPHTPLAPIFCNPEFSPGLTPQLFQWWLNKGLLRIGDFLNGNQLHTIQYFKDEFLMPPSEIFRYNQIALFARSKLNQVVGPLTFTTFELTCQARGFQRGRISAIYTSLTEPDSKLAYMVQWERDLNLTFDLTEWQDLAFQLSKVSINTTLIEANYKTLLRWYLVPTRVARMHPSTSPNCFRRCGQLGTMYHIWWQCPLVTRFWI